MVLLTTEASLQSLLLYSPSVVLFILRISNWRNLKTKTQPKPKQQTKNGLHCVSVYLVIIKLHLKNKIVLPWEIGVADVTVSYTP